MIMYIKYNSQRIIAIYICLQAEMCKGIYISILLDENIQDYTIVSHMSVFIKRKQLNAF